MTQQPYINPETRDRRVGVVLSDKRDKTRTVAVEYGQKHSKYGKYLTRASKFHVHDEQNESQVGDRVEIVACRPLSKSKCWLMTRILEKAPDKAQQVFTTDLEEVTEEASGVTTAEEASEVNSQTEE